MGTCLRSIDTYIANIEALLTNILLPDKIMNWTIVFAYGDKGGKPPLPLNILSIVYIGGGFVECTKLGGGGGGGGVRIVMGVRERVHEIIYLRGHCLQETQHLTAIEHSF